MPGTECPDKRQLETACALAALPCIDEARALHRVIEYDTNKITVEIVDLDGSTKLRNYVREWT